MSTIFKGMGLAWIYKSLTPFYLLWAKPVLSCKMSFLILLICFFQIRLSAQSEEEVLPKQNFSAGQENLLQTYLNHPGRAAERIGELQRMARQDRDSGEGLRAIQKVQIALMLEKQLPEPVIESFNLNFFAAQLIASSDLRYALEFYRKACDMIPRLKNLPLSSIFDLYTNRAGAHATIHEPDSALIYFHKAIQVAKQDNLISLVSSLNNIGVFFLNTAQYDSAKIYLNRALANLDDSAPSVMLYCAIRDNLTQLDIVHHDYQSALATFQYNDSVYLARQNSTKYVANKVRLLNAMQQLHMPGIDPQIPLLEAYMHQYAKMISKKEFLNFFQFADQYYYAAGKYGLAKSYQHQYLHWTDSLDQIASEQMHEMAQSLLAVQQVSFQNELKANELVAKQTRLELKSTRRTLLIALVSGTALLILLILYFQKRRQELQAKQQVTEARSRQKEMEARLFAQELDLKKKDLTNLVLHNTQVYDTNQKMIDRLHQMSSSKGEMEQHVRSLLIDLQSQNQVSERSNILISNIESVNAEFYEKLKEKFPELTKAEAELCGYIRINLSSKDIAILKNVEATSVKMGKNRLRKKLGIAPEEDIYALIQKV